MKKTMVSISEKTYSNNDVRMAHRREQRIIVHDGWSWYMGNLKNEKDLEDFLNFFEIELTNVEHEVELDTTGKIIYYNLSKNIINDNSGGFWNVEDVRKMCEKKEEKMKEIKGLSNGSIVDCYVGIGEESITVYRPNPNAKEVYKPMGIEERIKFVNNNWYI